MSGVVRAAARGASGRPRWLTPVAAATVPAVLATLAVLYPGAPVQQVDLNDGAVWLTNTSELRLGRYNPQVDELNAGLVATSAEFDVLQDEGDVLLEEPGRLSVVDPASVTLAAQTSVPTGAAVSLAGGTVVVADEATGDVWAGPLSLLGTLETGSQEPDLRLAPGGVALAAPDGAVLAVDAAGVIRRAELAEPATGPMTVEESGRLAGHVTGPFDQVTAVGDDLVVLSGGVLSTRFGSADLTRYGQDLVLQQAGPSAPSVLVASRTSLLDVPLDGGPVTEHVTGGSGRPAAPVLAGACGHAAWASGSGSYLQLCDGSAPEITDLEGMTTQDALVFRVNRDVVVLNDTLRGRLWLPLEDPELREPNWQDIEPREKVEQDENESQRRESTQNLQADCSAQSAAPAANDDEYGVRAGRTTILSVIDNDTSSDCGILTISEFDPVPEDFGTMVPIYGGRAFQLETLPGARGTVEVTYTISDGRGNNAPSTATVRLTVSEDADNEPPVQLRVGSLLVEQGATATYDVLPDFRDPDGDHLVLSDGFTDTGETVRTRQDGQLTFTSQGTSLGRRTVRLLVSDGTHTIEGSLLVDVRPAGSLPPVIEPVQAVTYVDEPVLVRPLDSVRTTSREPARLAGVDDLPGATVERDLPNGTFTFTAARAGSYYVTFLVTSPPQQATGVARIDVLERPEEVPPPTAVLDVALLPPGGEVTIAPLANDVDPGGAVLVLQSVEVPAETGLRAAVLNHELVRFTSTRVLEQPVTARYTISNGVASATGTVLVQPIPASAVQQPPVAPDVRTSVRTGGVVTIPVLEHAYDPDGDVVRLVPRLPEPLGEGEGLLFVSGDVLRYQAPATPTEVHATFEVTDPFDNKTAGTVTITVHASETSTKAPPRPAALTARVFQGETIRIAVPLTGIDPDGDGVSLLGQDAAPGKGRIAAVGPDWLEYEALPGELGTDTFTYAVEDWVGQRAVGTIRVGIAARPTTSAQVVTRNDDVTVRPGSSVEVRVLANDVDTGGGDLTLEPVLGLAEGVDAEVVGSRIVVRTPREPAVLQISYTAANLRGGRDSAVLTVTVTADATVQSPVARDVIVPASETINRSSVEVDVLAVAENPSGPMSDLAVSVDPSVADVARVTARGTVVVTLGERARTLPYLLTNTSAAAERLGTYAFITVPALGDFPPMLRPGAPELRVIAGEPLRIALAEQVQVAPGRTARLGDTGKISATKSDGSPVVADSRTLVYTAQRSYAGPASISFEVIDGDSGDPTARTKVLTLLISVLAAEDYPPTFSPSVIDVAPGESSRVDLTAFTSTAVGTVDGEARYTYRLRSGLPSGFDATLDGSVLTVRVGPTVPKGTVGGVAVEVGYDGGTLPAQVDFRVVASQRPLARVRDHVVPDGVEGVATTVSALDGAFNPFTGSPLTLESAVVETPGAGAASASGSQVTVRPGEGFIGTMITRYRVSDVTGDPDRDVEGRIVVTVRGRPDAPAAPRAVEVRDRTVVLAWDAPTNNGEPISGYRLTAQPGGLVKECVSTTCTFDGLSNNVEYRFSVAARNAVDWSEPSPLSAPARPDARPSAPQQPSLTWGDRSVAAAWQAPQNPGSPIVRYDVEISPAPPGGSPSLTTTATSFTFGDLTNGIEYTVRVRAVNAAPDPGDWSAWSSGQVPAAKPAAPVPTATRTGLGHIGSGRIDVSWPAPSGNGDAVIEYQVAVDGAPAVAPNAGATSHVIEPAGRGEYTIGVRARNKAGWSDWGSTTGEIWTVPSKMAAPTASGTPPGGASVDLSWSAPDSGGAVITGYDVLVDGATRTSAGAGSSFTVAGLVAGPHAFQVRACNSAGCGEWSRTSTAEVTTRPGDVRQLLIVFDDDVAPTTAQATWVEPADTGGLPLTYRYRFYLGDSWGEWQAVPVLSSPAVPIPNKLRTQGGQVLVEVHAVSSAGGRSPTDVQAQRTVPAPVVGPPTPEPPAEPVPPGGG